MNNSNPFDESSPGRQDQDNHGRPDENDQLTEPGQNPTDQEGSDQMPGGGQTQRPGEEGGMNQINDVTEDMIEEADDEERDRRRE